MRKLYWKKDNVYYPLNEQEVIIDILEDATTLELGDEKQAQVFCLNCEEYRGHHVKEGARFQIWCETWGVFELPWQIPAVCDSYYRKEEIIEEEDETNE